MDPLTGLTYNTGALIGPDGYIGKYRKNGLNPSDILWFTPGNTGYPVFDTELGRIAMIICYDDTYWEPARLVAVKGADLIAYICSSDRVLTELGVESAGNHSTIAAVQQLSAWNGLAMVAADRNNAESNPTTGISVVYGGSASIWQADGRRTGHLPATELNLTAANPGAILYGEIDPASTTTTRRRRCTGVAQSSTATSPSSGRPTDTRASQESHAITVTAVQYDVVAGDVEGNIDRANDQVLALQRAGAAPAWRCSRPSPSAVHPPTPTRPRPGRVGSGPNGAGVVRLRRAARAVRRRQPRRARRRRTVPHRGAGRSPDGTVAGTYRQTHLDPAYTLGEPR